MKCPKYQLENVAKIDKTILFNHSLIIKDDWNRIKNQIKFSSLNIGNKYKISQH